MSIRLRRHLFFIINWNSRAQGSTFVNELPKTWRDVSLSLSLSSSIGKNNNKMRKQERDKNPTAVAGWARDYTQTENVIRLVLRIGREKKRGDFTSGNDWTLRCLDASTDDWLRLLQDASTSSRVMNTWTAGRTAELKQLHSYLVSLSILNLPFRRANLLGSKCRGGEQGGTRMWENIFKEINKKGR